MALPPYPKTIFVASPRRNAGKTLVSALLLRSLPRAAAIKLTCCRVAGGCPRNRPCGVCGALSSPFAVIRDHDILAQPGKDTARLLAAAPGKVVWLQSREEALADGLAAALAALPDAAAVVVEGNAAFQAARADLGLLVIGAGPRPLKPSVNVALPFTDVVVLNARPGLPPPTVMDGLPSGVPVFTFDAARPGDQGEAQSFIQWVASRLGLCPAERRVTLATGGRDRGQSQCP